MLLIVWKISLFIFVIFVSITASSEELFDSLIGSSPEKQPKAIVAFSEESSSTISPQTKGKMFNIFNNYSRKILYLILSINIKI